MTKIWLQMRERNPEAEAKSHGNLRASFRTKIVWDYKPENWEKRIEYFDNVVGLLDGHKGIINFKKWARDLRQQRMREHNYKERL